MKFPIPDAALESHIAVLGKTGAGKTSTAKLIVERLAAKGARVCVLDPIKSDWWGLTSGADGSSRGGLDFSILGGPMGHVALHSGAGKAIGELVAGGALAHSILDMADFEPGGQQQFFVDFAAALLRKMRGVLHLVMEEAHEFAPKERAGFDKENMAIHFAKKLATAGRSKGVRLIVATQATQQLHNRVLGSCETMIVHRFTAPADQEPVVKWLKANTTKKEVEEVAGSLSRLATGEAWIVSGEAQIFERVKFPKIATYDNSATPTQGEADRHVIGRPVDLQSLRSLIGDAVAAAEQDDPKVLKKRIAVLEAQVESAGGEPEVIAVTQEITGDEPFVRAIGQAAYEFGLQEGLRVGVAQARKAFVAMGHAGEDHLASIEATIPGPVRWLDVPKLAGGGFAVARLDLSRFATRDPILPGADVQERGRPSRLAAPARPSSPIRPPEKSPTARKTASPGTSEGSGDPGFPGARGRVLIALAMHPQGLAARKLAILADIKRGGSTWRGVMAGLRREGYIRDNGEQFHLTPEGRKALGPNFKPLPTGPALREFWRNKMNSTRLALFDAIVDAYPRAADPETVARVAEVQLGGSTWRGHMAKLRGLELVTKDELRAAPELFE